MSHLADAVVAGKKNIVVKNEGKEGKGRRGKPVQQPRPMVKSAAQIAKEKAMAEAKEAKAAAALAGPEDEAETAAAEAPAAEAAPAAETPEATA